MENSFDLQMLHEEERFKRAKFAQCNLHELKMVSTCAHDGEGEIGFCRIADEKTLDGTCHFIDYAIMPPHTAIGEHLHRVDEEEFYLVIEGHGIMRINGKEFSVRAGDLIRNPPSGSHALRNPGPGELKLFVFEVTVNPKQL